MRFSALIVLVNILAPSSLAQGNCSDGSVGMILSVSSITIIDAGEKFQACFAIEGDPRENQSWFHADVTYNPDAIHPDWGNESSIPDSSPFPKAGYVTDLLFCLGSPDVCPYFLAHVYKSINEPPYLNLPEEPVEFACALFNVQDSSETAWIDVSDVAGGQGDGSPVTVCPDEDQGWYDGPVPVELLFFDAIVHGTDVTLRWATASETNNAGFEVQMLTTGGDYDVLGFVQGHGTTTEAQSYSYRAADLPAGTHTFRVKQIDFDGAFEYSEEVEATIEVVGTHQLSSAYPNPFNPHSQFTLAVATAQQVKAELFNTLGQRVAVLFNGRVEANQVQHVTIDGAGLASGIYVVRVNGERFSDALSVTLLK